MSQIRFRINYWIYVGHGSALMMAVTETVSDEDGQVSDAKKQGAYVYGVSLGFVCTYQMFSAVRSSVM